MNARVTDCPCVQAEDYVPGCPVHPLGPVKRFTLTVQYVDPTDDDGVNYETVHGGVAAIWEALRSAGMHSISAVYGGTKTVLDCEPVQRVLWPWRVWVYEPGCDPGGVDDIAVVAAYDEATAAKWAMRLVAGRWSRVTPGDLAVHEIGPCGGKGTVGRWSPPTVVEPRVRRFLSFKRGDGRIVAVTKAVVPGDIDREGESATADQIPTED